MLLLALDAVAFLGSPLGVPPALDWVAGLAISLDLWLVDNAAYPGFFLLGLIAVALVAFPELSAGILWLTRRTEPPRFRVGLPHVHADGAERHYRMIVTNAGGEIAANVQVLLRAIEPKPRSAGWRADFPYAMTWVSAPPGHEGAPCNIAADHEETFEVIAGWPAAEGGVVCAGLDTKSEGAPLLPIEDDERWILSYEVIADNVPALGFALEAAVEGGALVVERKPEKKHARDHLDPRRLRR